MSEPAFGAKAFDPATGQIYQLSPSGWQPISDEAATAEQGVGPSAVRSLQQMGMGMGNLLGMRFEGQQGIEEAQAAGMASNPTATTVGSYLPDVASLFVPGFAASKGAAAARSGRMAERVAARADAAAGQRARMLGGDSVGAAAADVSQGPIRDRVAGFFNDMMNAQDMTPDQARMLPVGRRLGFEELPGMRGRGDSPGKMMLGAAMSNPSVRFAVQDTLDNNAAILEKYAMRALQAPAEPFGKGGIEFARRGIASGFERVRSKLPETVELPEQWVADFTRVKGGLASELGEVLEEGTNRISRDDLMALRSDLNLVASDLAAPGSGRRLAGNRVGALSRDLDDIIKGYLGPEEAPGWQRTREAWLFSELLKKPGVVQPDGSLSLASAAGVMRREMPDAWADVLDGAGRSRLSPEASDFMDALDYANTFRDLVPNSGTATRQAIGKLGARDLVQGQMLRYYLRRARDELNPPPPEP